MSQLSARGLRATRVFMSATEYTFLILNPVQDDSSQSISVARKPLLLPKCSIVHPKGILL